MPKLHLNEKAILRMKAPHPSGMETIYWDAALTGFGVLCQYRRHFARLAGWQFAVHVRL
jgi:hypothetical protein